MCIGFELTCVDAYALTFLDSYEITKVIDIIVV